ncbi:selenocysteine lyase-like, partial [Dendronephthya gigantea]|uniref:selenocysteine lyase-like n=1 Tax=Dendronephthya gigantea TaxID=151771 RepID=UPI00106A453A
PFKMADLKEENTSKTVYLDYNATTPLAPSVLQIINETLRDAWGNPSSSHVAGKKAKDVIKLARSRVGDMIGARVEDIIFTSGGTEANNIVFWSLVKHFKTCYHVNEATKSLPHIITSNIEHDSVSLAIDNLVKEGYCEKSVVGVTPSSGMVDVDRIIDEIRPNTCLVSIMMANNESGVIQPINEIVSRIRKLQVDRDRNNYCKIFIHTDAAQAIGKIKVDVSELGVDYLTIVGHKFYAPRIGALFVRSPSKETPLYPMLFGGGQERGFRPGTENTGMIAGLGEAAKLVVDNLNTYSAHMRKVRDYLETRLVKIFPDKIHFNGKFNSSERIPNTCNFSILGPGLQGFCILSRLKRTQVSLGAACHADQQFSPSRILLAMGIDKEIAGNALRVSVGRETSLDDIDIVLSDLEQAVNSIQQTTMDVNKV